MADGAQKRRTPTINDVACRAGTSIGTVSRFINGQPVRPENRERIEKAIGELSYAPNAFASAMKSEDTRMVGLLVPDYDEFHASLFGNLSKTLRQDGFVTLTYQHESDAQAAMDALHFFRMHRVRALVLAGFEGIGPEIEAMLAQGVKVIMFDDDTADPGVDKVLVNNRQASAVAVSRLIGLGHTRIAVVTGDMSRHTAQHRLSGWRDAFVQAGIDSPDDLIEYSDWLRSGGETAMQRLWNRDARPTAVFSCNHQMTLGILNYLRAHEVAIPRDISLVSFDEVETFRFVTPGVTAIEQPVDRIAETIKQRLLARLSGDDSPAKTDFLQCKLHFRGSMSPPAQTLVRR